MRFRKDNKIRYGQDHRQMQGIPSGVDFEVRRITDTLFALSGEGYGDLSGLKYGNGSLYVSLGALDKRTRERFEKNVIQ